MKAQAMYVGKRKYNRKETTNEETGEVIPAKKGMQYLFYCSDWEEDDIIDGMGRTRFESVEEKDVDAYEEKLPALGGFCTVKIKENFGKDNNSVCELVEAI